MRASHYFLLLVLVHYYFMLFSILGHKKVKIFYFNFQPFFDYENLYTKETHSEKQFHYSNLFISILSSSTSLSSNALTASSVKIVFLRCKIVYTFKAANKQTKRTVSNWLVKTEAYVEKRDKLIVWFKRCMLIHKPKL